MRHATSVRSTLVRGLLVLLAFTFTPAFAGSGGQTPYVIPPKNKVIRKIYEQLSAQHWKWLFSFPADAHPLADSADCSAGQSGLVWFLGGTFASIEIEPGVILGQATRECTIPSHVFLFFPIVDVECSTIEGNGETEAELRECAEFFADFIDPDSLSCTVDGKPVKNLANYRVQSPLFTFGPLPENNVLEASGIDAPAGSTSDSVSDGVFVLLTPLPRGHHTIKFTGLFDLSDIGGPIFIQDITYNLRVVSPLQYYLEHYFGGGG